MRPLIAGNWKMHGTVADTRRFAAALREAGDGLPCDLLVCPPATLLHLAATELAGTRAALGGQDCHAAASGAHTGDIAAAMLREVGASHVILGHSERRRDHGETSAQVQAKVRAAVAAGLIAIVCVGETEAERHAGQQHHVVGRQLAGSLPDGFGGVIAYEPVWAVGTGVIPTADDIAAMHRFIRSALLDRFGAAAAQRHILYGGSVKPDNAAGLLRLSEVGGALIGGASLQAADFLAIARASAGP